MPLEMKKEKKDSAKRNSMVSSGDRSAKLEHITILKVELQTIELI